MVIPTMSTVIPIYKITKSCSIPISDILQCDILETNTLSNDKAYTIKPKKHELLCALEVKLNSEDRQFL